ncbi:sulfatase [Halolamina sp. CBA1230]|uniref:sulfatase n=1 Tax=Halolamina sp. CBA1230 TaxID=1853690 RepID=UPI0009A23809|nr:sulfatase [Halolamina sp. CBA1230]QKY19776.1 sulfatase [Halolamina sp. CBA1230]
MQTVLITVDSLRADHLGQYGYDRDTMPVLDELLDGGTRFENAFANAPYTRISVPSLLTSEYLAYDDLERTPTIASRLEDEDITTAVIGTQTGIGLVDGDFNFGETIDLGRDSYHEEANTETSAMKRVQQELSSLAVSASDWLQAKGATGVNKRLRGIYRTFFGGMGFNHLGYTSAEKVTDRAIEWVNEHASEPFFLWLHYMEAHRPYGVHDENPAYLDRQLSEERIKQLMESAGTAPEQVAEEERQLLIDLYDSDARYCSRQLSRLFDSFRSAGLWDDANIVFTSDHGEEFREHGSFFHRNYPYDELTHVPLITRTPDQGTPDDVSEQRELLDVTPTVCDLHDISLEDATLCGRSLFDESERERLFALGQPIGEPSAVAVRTDRWKYVHSAETRQLYDLRSDPEERTNVASEHADVADELYNAIPERLLTRDVEAPRAPEDEVDREHLEALGYMEVRGDE